jgi:hypothetical protein
MTSVNKALAEIATASRKNDMMTDNEVGNCMYRFKICDKLLADVKREQDLYKKKNILQRLFNEIKECVSYCKLPFMSVTIQKLMDDYDETNEEFNKAVDEHNARLDAEDALVYDPFSGKPPPKAGSRRRNKKSKNSKKRSKKSRKTKSPWGF